MGRPHRAILAGGLCVVVLVTPASPQVVLNLVLGRKLVVNDASRGTNPTRRRMTATVQQQGGFLELLGDPTVHGALFAVEVESIGQTWTLPPSGWRAIRGGFSYADASGANGAVLRLKIRDDSRDVFSIKVAMSGAKAPLAIVPPNPGTEGGIAVVLDSGQGYCAWYGGVAGGTVRNDGARFFDVRNPTGPGLCPSGAYPTTLPPTTSTSSTTSTSVTTTSSTSSTTTTILGPPCAGVVGPAPFCWGECPPETPVCAVVDGACQCVSGTLPCGGIRELECDGACPVGQVCVSGGLDCACMPAGGTPCLADNDDFVCGGFCPPDESCVYVDVPSFYTGCFCTPPGCAIDQPPPLQDICGGPCPPGRECAAVVIPNVTVDCLCMP